MRRIEYFGPIDGTPPKYLNGYKISNSKKVGIYHGSRGKPLFGKFKATIEGEDALFLKLTVVDKKFRIY